MLFRSPNAGDNINISLPLSANFIKTVRERANSSDPAIRGDRNVDTNSDGIAGDQLFDDALNKDGSTRLELRLSDIITAAGGSGLLNGGGPLVGKITYRSEERRVGKECRSRWSPYH